MPYYKKMAGAKCYLSPICIEDAETWAGWFNDLAVTIPLGDEAYTPLPVDGLRDQIKRNIESQAHVFDIVQLDTDRPIGRCMLFAVNQVDRNAMAGIAIGEKDCWGQGYGAEAMRLLLEYGFMVLNLHSIMLGVYAFNERAIACYKRVGFKEIGRRREARIIGPRRYDAIFMDILAGVFLSLHGDKLTGPYPP